MQQLCQCRLSLTCELLMNGFIESNALYSAQRLSVATYASYRAAHYNTGATSSCMYTVHICMYVCMYSFHMVISLVVYDMVNINVFV